MAAAPGATAVLADFGASVTKVEGPKGDPWRRIGMKEFGKDGSGREFGPYFDHDNRRKRSVVLDLQSSAGVEAFHLLLSTTDVLVSNVRVAGTQRLKLDYESLKKRYPMLIYAHLTAWGRKGPMRDAPGYDAGAFWAASGMLDLLRASDEQRDMPRLPGGAGDHATSMALVSGITMALFQRERIGSGCLVDVSLLRAGLWCNAMPLLAAAVAPSAEDVAFMRDPLRNGVTFRAYRCRDGAYLQLLGYQSGRHMSSLLKALGLKEAPPSVEGFDALMLTKDAADWERIFDSEGVWYTRIVKFDEPDDLLRPPGAANGRGSMSQVAAQAAASGAWLEGANNKLVASPIRFESEDGQAHIQKSVLRAPRLGEHTEEALREAGANEEQMAQLAARGAFGAKNDHAAKRRQSRL
eukprot:TRINITY_DN12318_c0_g1_i1.p1 TRINITY_DN12318_c0_g1~~TRINITY_DN12318_c0_g1_i1.p1  ORF type:complete len:438 (-),score=55.79 TRINITY_DN12318_c0_g1_i1:120-1346(-)